MFKLKLHSVRIKMSCFSEPHNICIFIFSRRDRKRDVTAGVNAPRTYYIPYIVGNVCFHFGNPGINVQFKKKITAKHYNLVNSVASAASSLKTISVLKEIQ